MRKLVVYCSVLFLVIVSPVQMLGSTVNSVNQVELTLGNWEPGEEKPPVKPQPPAGEVAEEKEVETTSSLPQTGEKENNLYSLVGIIVLMMTLIVIYYKRRLTKKV